MLLNRLLPHLTIVLIFFGWEILFKKPKGIYFLVIFFIIWILLVIWKLLGLKSITKITYWNFLTTPILLILSGGIFLVFIEKAIIKHLLFLVIAILIGLFLETLFIYIYEHENYRSPTLENISRLINLISFYFYLSGIYGLAIFLSLSIWLRVVITLPVIIISIYQIFWINKVKAKKSWLHLLVISLILIELFIAVNTLPTSFYVNGFILGVIYYLMTNLSLDYFSGQIKKGAVSRYLLFSFLMLLLVLITAQWT